MTFSSLHSRESGCKQRPQNTVTQGLMDVLDTNDGWREVVDGKGLGAGVGVGWERPRTGALPEGLKGSETPVYSQPPMLPTQGPTGPSERTCMCPPESEKGQGHTGTPTPVHPHKLVTREHPYATSAWNMWGRRGCHGSTRRVVFQLIQLGTFR